MLSVLSSAFSLAKTARNSDASGGTDDASLAGEEVDVDGVPDIADVWDITPAGSAVGSQGRPLGDVNKDCDTDLMDYTLLQQRLTGRFRAPDFGECEPVMATTGCSKSLCRTTPQCTLGSRGDAPESKTQP